MTNADGQPKINSSQNESPKIDSLSPYYLGNQDGPGANLIHIKLRNDNYEEWSRSMKRSLKSRRKFGFCDGTLKKPTDAFFLEQWEVVNCTVVQWIMHSIDISVKDSISYYEEAAPLWTELHDRFAVVDGTVIHSIKTQISECKQTKGMSVTTYYGKLKVLWDALAAHEPPFACKCGRCTCNIAPEAIKRQDSERLHQFFMGLDATKYGVIRSQQFQSDPLPSLSRAYHVVLQEERLRGYTTVSDETPPAPDIMAYAVKSGPRLSTQEWRLAREREKQEKRKLLCSHCTCRGHEINGCFFKTGVFSEWWGDRPRILSEYLKTRSGGQPTASGAASTVRTNLVTSGSSPQDNIASTDRLSGPHFEDDDWVR